MLIRTIEVYELFGIFNHQLKLNTEDKITIIHGPNGVGKTIILKMLYNLFTLQNFDIFFQIPYHIFSLTFDNGNTFTIRRAVTEESIKSNPDQLNLLSFVDAPNAKYLARVVPVIDIVYEDAHFKPLLELTIPFEEIKYFKDLKSPETSRHLRQYFRKNHPYLDQVGPKHWIDVRTGERLDYEDIKKKFSISFFFDETEKYKVFADLIGSINVQLIETQRLLTVGKKKASKYYSESEEEEFVHTVKHYSEGLAKSIREYRDKYAALTQKLDRDFPFKLLESSDNAHEINQLKAELQDLEEQRKSLIEFGLLDEEDSANFFPMLSKIKDENRTVLTLYANDMKDKLRVFKELAEKIKVFKEIIDKKFNKYKHLKFGKSFGFAFSTNEGQMLSLTDLSSGEQHEIVLLYELLFKIRPNSLILIDEPELSLHVAWQREFLDDLQRISAMSNLEFLVATHSPSIIAGRDDLTIELSGV